MSIYENNVLPLEQEIYICDGGLETTLVFEEGIELPEFAAFILLNDESGRKILWDYFLSYIALAKQYHFGFILESPTWRASRAWGEKLGYGDRELADINCQAIEMLAKLRRSYADSSTPMAISGCIGPRGDGYHIDRKMTTAEAREYHSAQIRTFSKTEADFVSAYTLNYAEEAIGITEAAQQYDIPAVISFTVETDGRLPSGQPLGTAIKEVDEATANGPAYYMINCAHPTHFEDVLASDAQWKHRIQAIRANASCKSHDELDRAEDLDSGDPARLGDEYVKLTTLLPNLKVFGGCCGTDVRHVEQISKRLKERVVLETA